MDCGVESVYSATFLGQLYTLSLPDNSSDDIDVDSLRKDSIDSNLNLLSGSKDADSGVHQLETLSLVSIERR